MPIIRAKLPGGTAHVIVLLVTVGTAYLVFEAYPDLISGDVATFGSVGVFVTIYAALFALIEALRAKSTARVAESATKEVAETFRRMSRTESITACAHHIETAIETFNDGHGLPITLLSKIVALYSQVFSAIILDSKSEHAEAKALIVAFIGHPKPPKNPTKTLVALTQMKSHLLIVKESIVFPETT